MVIRNSSGVGEFEALKLLIKSKVHDCGRCGGLMVSVLNSGSSSSGSRPGQGHCIVFMGKTLHFHSASLHPGV